MTKYIKIEGSVYSQKRHRHSRWGTYDPSSKDKKKVIPQIVDQFMEKPFDNAVMLEMNLLIERPKSHWNKYNLKPSAPKYPIGRIGDIDNFAKFYLDVLVDSQVLSDDSLVISLLVTKQYTSEYQEPYVEIIITDFK